MSKKNEMTSFIKKLKSFEQKWQKEWDSEGIYEVDPIEGKKKFFITDIT